MLKPEYKLIRDKITDIIKVETHSTPIVKTLNNTEFRVELELKLKEKVLELLLADDLSAKKIKLADIYEILDYLIKTYSTTAKTINDIRKDIRKKRGAFNKKQFLIMIEK